MKNQVTSSPPHKAADMCVGVYSSDRITYIDVIKGIGILLVVFVHCLGGRSPSTFLPEIKKEIASFFMPLFFFISGFLYKKKDAKDFFVGKTTTLLIPYIIVQFVNWISRAGVLVICKATGTTDFSSMIRLNGFWFIRVLLYISIIYYSLDMFFFERAILKRIPIKYIMLIASAGTFTIAMGYSYYSGGGASEIVSSFVALFYFSIGVCIRERYSLFPSIRRWKAAVIGICIMIILYFICTRNTIISVAYNEYGNPLLFLICSVMGIIGVYLIGYSICNNGILEFYLNFPHGN